MRRVNWELWLKSKWNRATSSRSRHRLASVAEVVRLPNAAENPNARGDPNSHESGYKTFHSRLVAQSAPRRVSHDLAIMAENLETRELLVAAMWDGGGDGVHWSDPLNWSGDTLPGSADDVTIDLGSNTIQNRRQ